MKSASRVAVASWLLEVGNEFCGRSETVHHALALWEDVVWGERIGDAAGKVNAKQRERRGARERAEAKASAMQVLAAACIFAAAKLVEGNTLDVDKLVALGGESYTVRDIVLAEIEICERLTWRLRRATCVDGLRYLCGEDADVSIDTCIDLEAQEELDNPAAVSKKAWGPLRWAEAFADVGVHCRGLCVVYGAGEVSAACAVLAKIVSAASGNVAGSVWMGVFDDAGLKLGDIVGAALLILHTWDALCVTEALAGLVKKSELFRDGKGVASRDQAELVSGTRLLYGGDLSTRSWDVACAGLAQDLIRTDRGAAERMLRAVGGDVDMSKGADFISQILPFDTVGKADGRNAFVLSKHRDGLRSLDGVNPVGLMNGLRGFYNDASTVATPVAVAIADTTPVTATPLPRRRLRMLGSRVTPSAGADRTNLRPRKGIRKRFTPPGVHVSPVAYDSGCDGADTCDKENEKENATTQVGSVPVRRSMRFQKGSKFAASSPYPKRSLQEASKLVSPATARRASLRSAASQSHSIRQTRAPR